jgi:hypothetical protein
MRQLYLAATGQNRRRNLEPDMRTTPFKATHINQVRPMIGGDRYARVASDPDDHERYEPY